LSKPASQARMQTDFFSKVKGESDVATSLKIPAQPFKDKEFSIAFFNLMVRNRILEERIIKMAKTGDGFFWIGGPGEEAFNISLGLQVEKGFGVGADILHLHYRSNGVLLAMGAPMVDMIRQMRSSSQDPFSGGRNFVSHIAKKEWNIMPVTSTIETQFVVAPGTALAQKRAFDRGEKSGISIVVGGDAGTAEGDFATALVWSSRPETELPLLMIVTNNQYGISTPADTQHGEKLISDRGKAFGIRTATIEGHSPEKVWSGLEEALDYVRNRRKPYLLEVTCSRLYGHSSSTGANRIQEEICPIETFEKKLIKNGWLSKVEIEEMYKSAWDEANAALEQARTEQYPDASTVLEHSFQGTFKGGLPGRGEK
jgi:2-oxoisovalerate dehydrogenase E1 component alpha subunit